MNSSPKPTPRWNSLASAPQLCARLQSFWSSEKNELGWLSLSCHPEGARGSSATRARLRGLLLCECLGVQWRPQHPTTSTTPFLPGSLESLCYGELTCIFLSPNSLSVTSIIATVKLGVQPPNWNPSRAVQRATPSPPLQSIFLKINKLAWHYDGS